MNRIKPRKIIQMLLLIGALWVLAGGETKAWNGPVFDGGVSPVSYGTYSAVVYASSRPYGYSSCYYPGPINRAANRIRARRAARVSYYGSYASYYGATSNYAGCCDPCAYVVAYPSCCCTLCCDPCCCGDLCCCGDCFYHGADGFDTASCCAPAVDHGDQPTPANTDKPSPTPAPAPTPAPTPEAADSSARIEVTLPAAARLYVNGRLTTSTGDRRQYLSAGLRPGSRYAYRIRVEYQRLGQEVVELRTIRMRAGQRIAIEFPDTGLAATKTSTARLASLP